ncbi:MAG: 30S ribosomal protein S14 [Cytophagales bacterium]|jgi:small subunit ribosomal protein S14|nr:30S ribosomal protein S14 [Cytophagales bacterium]
MAKLSIIVRNEKRKKVVELCKIKREFLKKNKDYAGLRKLPRNASPIRLKNRCCVTGRGRGFIRRFGLSRLVFREMASEGLIPGVSKI